MDKKKTSKASKSVKNLPVKTASVKTANGVKGGFVAVEHGGSGQQEGPKETVTFGGNCWGQS